MTKLQEFTFHHVSIKTSNVYTRFVNLSSFTFHHVSIKTKDAIVLSVIDVIHIPPCIY